MKKSIIATAVLSALSMSSAFADVEVGPVVFYGTLQSAVEGINVSKNGGTAVQSKMTESQTRLMDQSSTLGFKGKYSLDGGSFALAQVESRLYLGNNGTNSDDKAELGGRNTFVGVGSTTLGTVRMGRYDNAYKLSVKQASNFIKDNLNDTSGDVGDKQIINRLGARQGDMVAYESPLMAGFAVNASYNLGKDSTNSISGGTTNNTAKNTVATDLMPQLALGMGYTAGPLKVGVGYTSIANANWKLDGKSAANAVNTSTGSQKLIAYQIGAQYTFGSYSLGALMEQTSSSLDGVGAYSQSQKTYGLVGAYKVTGMEIQVRYALADDVSGTTVTDTGADQLAVAFSYELGKNLKFISSVTQLTNKKNAGFTSASAFALPGNGYNMTQIAVGLAATF
jgi:predicted porin